MITNSADAVTWTPDPANSTPVLQAAVDHMMSNYGSGKLFIPPGNYATQNLQMKGGVVLVGSGRGATVLQSQNQDVGVVNFDGSCNYAGMRDLFVAGYTNPAARNSNAVHIAVNVPVMIYDCTIWGGNSALFSQGVDGTVSDCFISGWSFASLVSNGANWYRRCKFDTTGQHCQYGFYQGTPIPGGGVMENHFTDCDFSGDYDASIGVYDGNTNTAVSIFHGGVFSSPIRLAQAKHTSFIGAEFGSSDFEQGVGTCAIEGSVAFVPLNAPKAIKGNVNIT